MANKYICKNCGKEYYSRKKTSVYCSRKCRREYTNIDMVCDYCGKEFKIKKSTYLFGIERNQKKYYCSKDCANKAKTTSKTNICKNCHKEYKVFNCFSDIQLFCSRECYYEYISNNKKKYDYRTCPVCGKIFYPKRSDQKYCSEQCSKNLYTQYEKDYIKEHYLLESDTEMAKALNRSQRSITFKRLEMKLYREPNEDNLHCELGKYVRSKLSRWKRRVLKENNHRCALSGQEDDLVIHHCRGVNLLLVEAMDELDFPIRQNILDYTNEELDALWKKFYEVQERYRQYVCISTSIHKDFHSQYGYGSNTIEQWQEYCQNYS